MVLLERTASYSTRLPKDDSQVAGYRGERNGLLALLRFCNWNDNPIDVSHVGLAALSRNATNLIFNIDGWVAHINTGFCWVTAQKSAPNPTFQV